MTQISADKNQNLLSLCRIKKDCFYPPITVDFTPILRPPHKYQSILPTFNQDQHYFTPAFVNPYQRCVVRMGSENGEKHERDKFFKKIEANLSKLEEDVPFFNPKDDLYCSICGVSFHDYWKHIGLPTHHRRLVGSVGDRFIRELCQPIHQPDRQSRRGKDGKSQTQPKKRKKIKKVEDAKRCSRKNKKGRNQDLIIKLPKDLFEREERAQLFNLSTNGVTTPNPKP